jgi:isoleucyl-tRNA synthetase
MADKNDVKNTLNLPRTTFAMKAALAQKEPEIIKKWQEMDLYGEILKKRQGFPSFVLHDGPPYANGHIHLGTALNKILKDFIVKSKSMEGHLAPYVPGWDCHGLPIEIHVDKLLGGRKKDMSLTEFREECRKYALKYIDIQRNGFIRLGVLGEWNQPYLTMNPSYEAEILRHLAAFFASGNVYKGKRPVYWCVNCKTALAEAEIEYKDHSSPSIYAKFPMISDLSIKYPALGGKKVSVIIWTTTPWTLPANLAIAFHPEADYVAAETKGGVYILAKKLLPVVAQELDFGPYEVLAEFKGDDLKGLKARHPWIDRPSVFVTADYVTLEDGTGCVHTAPGHGHDDYLTGVSCGLDIYTPVDEEGLFVPEVEKYGGQNVFRANKLITEDMRKDDSLLKETEIRHSYPHCWRCKNPVIFRATEQWFISMDKGGLRARALEEIKKTTWLPRWGEERISGMVENRPDWCISRQRSWGVPIPAFTCKACGAVVADATIALHVADIFEREGANAWFLKEPEELLPSGTKCPSCGGAAFEKENNILDVWFESGTSHSILGKRPDLPWPADVYIEGHDQHRGWFNSSLLVGVGVKGHSPYKACITCGFILDEQGRAMSKSLGNTIDPEEIVSKNGAEILRLWVAMLNYREDARFGPELQQRLVEAYRKIRNTWRFILGNLYDFSPEEDSVPAGEMRLLDRWILQKCAEVRNRALKGYTDYEFHVVFHAMYDFFTVALSSFYLDVIKDRAYCSGKKSDLRRSAQTALFGVLKDTLALMAPILPFTTDEAWESMPGFSGKSASIHLELFPSAEETWLEPALVKDMDDLIEIRDKALKELEKARECKLIGNSLEARVVLGTPSARRELLEKYRDSLPELFIVSAVELEPAAGEDLVVRIEKAPGEKCERCWNRSETVGKDAAHPSFCARCARVVRDIER